MTDTPPLPPPPSDEPTRTLEECEGEVILLRQRVAELTEEVQLAREVSVDRAAEEAP